MANAAGSKDELAALKNLLAALESREMRLSHGSVDCTAREAAILKREIKQLEETLAWVRKHNGAPIQPASIALYPGSAAVTR